MPVERPYFVVLILKIYYTIAFLKGPAEGKAILGAGAILAEGYRVVFLATRDTWIQRIEYAVIIGVESSLLISPGGNCQKIDILPVAMLIGTPGQGKTGGDHQGEYGPLRLHPDLLVLLKVRRPSSLKLPDQINILCNLN